MCRACGLIGKHDYKTLELYRDIRNRFAHEPGKVELTEDDTVPNFAQFPAEVRSLLTEAFDGLFDHMLPGSDAKSFSQARRQFMLNATIFHAWIQSIEIRLRDNHLDVGTLIRAVKSSAAAS
jgi:hypothetical protein